MRVYTIKTGLSVHHRNSYASFIFIASIKQEENEIIMEKRMIIHNNGWRDLSTKAKEMARGKAFEFPQSMSYRRNGITRKATRGVFQNDSPTPTPGPQIMARL